jgi:hypothetical protein
LPGSKAKAVAEILKTSIIMIIEINVFFAMVFFPPVALSVIDI